MIYLESIAERELFELFEETFDTCTTNKEEIIWLICLLRGLMNLKNKRIDSCQENVLINKWQYELHPILEKYKKRWKCSNYE